MRVIRCDSKRNGCQSQKQMKQFQYDLEDLVSRLEDDGKAPQYITGIMKVIKSWLSYNDITLTRRIKVNGQAVALFSLNSFSAIVFDRTVGNQSLDFNYDPATEKITDIQTGSEWNFEGNAIKG